MEDFYNSLDEILNEVNAGKEVDFGVLRKKFPGNLKEIDSIESIAGVLNDNIHIPFDTLASYAYFKHTDDNELRYFEKLSFKIEAHLQNCEQCKDEYNLLLEEVKETDLHVRSELQTISNNVESGRKNWFLNSSISQYAAAAVIVIAFLYSGLYGLLNLNRPIYESGISEDFSSSVTRGRMTEEFNLSALALQKNDYENAILHLKNDISKNQNPGSVFYSEYLLGLTYLKSAEIDFIGLYNSFELAKVDSAIKYLKRSAEHNKLEDFSNIKLDTYYYLGKANLIIGNFEEGKTYLTKVVEGKGKFIEKAKVMLEQLEG